MSGNNKKAEQIVRIDIPLFTDAILGSVSGQKYFFPEHPEIDRKTVVGIEAHTDQGLPAFGADLSSTQLTYIRVLQLQRLYLSFYNDKNEMVFENIPATFLLPAAISGAGSKFKFSIMPFLSKIKTRSCYAQYPANSVFLPVPSYITLTFYLR